jgi:hypothetical protein
MIARKFALSMRANSHTLFVFYLRKSPWQKFFIGNPSGWEISHVFDLQRDKTQ